jgi:integrase
MAKVVLNERSILALRPKHSGRYSRCDAIVPGLEVRVYPSGHKSYLLGARYPGSKQQFTRRELGQVGVIPLAAVREKARAWLLSIKSGIDPAVLERQQRATVAAVPDNSFRHVAEAFIARHLSGQRKGWRVAHEIRRELIPAWGNLPIDSISRQQVVELVEAVVDRGAKRHAHTIFSHVRLIFNWAIGRSIYNIEHSPCDRLKPIQLIGQKRTRERVLNDSEIRALWSATSTLGYPYGTLTKLLLLCGCRLNEAAKTKWSELSDRSLVIPPERFKTGQQHVVPLSVDAMNLINQEVVRCARSDFIFTSSGARAVGDFFAAKKKLDTLMPGVTGWTFHDLRRTYRTRLAELRVPDAVAELALGHARRGMAGVYDRHGYRDEIRDAMERWSERLRVILDPEQQSNIIRRQFRAPT